MALGFLATKARQDVLTLSLPADLAPGLVDALDHLAGGAAADRQVALDELARDLAAGGPLTAKRDLLSELLAVALDAGGERVALQGTRLLRGEGSAAELRAEVTRVSGLLDLLDAVTA